MESEEKENIKLNGEELTVDLSRRSLKKIEPANNEQKEAVALILDRNELQRLENLDTYTGLVKLSLASNRLIRMEAVSCMTNLTTLDISNNSLVCIEGLKDLKQLKHLNLSGNKIKTIDHLTYNVNLEYLDLSQNIIGHVSDMSFLQQLKELFLHDNEIAHLRQCEKNLPCSLEALTLHNNFISDLNEISHLVLLKSLKVLSIARNPCLESGDCRIDFNYRPFVKNWCPSIVTLDGYPLDDIECLKAEWLYSQGRGRSFRPGEHVALMKYLTGVCPRTAEQNAESEDDKKLRLILSKAQHHQQQLKDQVTGGSPLPNRHKLPLNRKKSAAMTERMVSSYHDSASSKESSRSIPDLMTRSLDGVLIRNSPTPSNSTLPESYRNPLQTATTLLPVPESLTSPDVCRSLHQFPTPGANSKISFPLTASYPSRSPLPSSKSSHFSPIDAKSKTGNVLRRQNYNSSPIAGRKVDPSKSRLTPTKGVSPKKKPPSSPAVSNRKTPTNGKESSDEEDSEISQKLQNHKKCKKKTGDEKENLEQICRKKDVTDSDVWRAALCIQRFWRGYRTRNLNQEVVEAYKNIQTIRIQDYIIKVANDMEATKVALEGHRKLQVLQMQAINALWKKMVSLQPGEGSENKSTLQGLAETCLNLNKQVEELQSMMKVMHHSSHSQSIPIATQTEIVAVHTPQGEGKEVFPYCPRLERPCVLPVSEKGKEVVLQQDEGKLSSRSGSTTDSNECGIESSCNSDDKDKEESVCLTPACQEGRDLQGVSGEADKKSQTEEKSKTSESSSADEDAHSTLFQLSGLDNQLGNDQEYQRNGCPSS